MKVKPLHLTGALALTLSACGCVPSVEPPAPSPDPVRIPASTSTPTPAPAPPPPIVQEPVFENFLDAPQTPGTWGYEDAFDGSTATFLTDQGVELVFWCDKDTNVIGIDRTTRSQPSADRILNISTETVSRQFNMTPVRSMSVTAQFSAQDSILDAMAITKGRFAVGVEGLRTLYLPAWAEVTRVIEDCR